MLLVTSKLFLKKNFLAPNLYLFNMQKENLPKVKRVLFALNDPEYMHLGDHLFFLPLIKSFIENGYLVDVTVSPLMVDLFLQLEIPVINAPNVSSQYDLIVSRFELIHKFSKEKALLVHVSKNLTMPICSQLLYNFSQYFQQNFNSSLDFSRFKDLGILTKLHLPANKKFILFNPYCNASAYLVTKAKLKELQSEVIKYASNKEYCILLVGSKADKLNDRITYPFELVDLRGKTTVIDIFVLVNTDNVVMYIGFDAFVMHVFSLLHKPSTVKFRGRITKKQSEMLAKYHVNLFKEDNYVKLI